MKVQDNRQSKLFGQAKKGNMKNKKLRYGMKFMGRDRPWEKEKSRKLKETIEIIKRIKETIKGHKEMGAPGIKGDEEALQHAIDILERVNEEGIGGAIPMSFTKGPFGEECKVAYFQGTAEIGGTVRKRDIVLSILDYLRGKDE